MALHPARIIRTLRDGRRARAGSQESGPERAPDPATQLILDSGAFDTEWYGAQAGTVFADPAEAVGHYLAHGRRQGWSPHPLFFPQRFRPRTWERDRADPVVVYLKTSGDTWRTSTSPLFDPARGDLPHDGEHSPLLAFLAAGVDTPLPLAADAGWLRDGVTLADVREALRSELRAQDEDTSRWQGGPAAVTVPDLVSVVVVDCDATSDVLSALAAIDQVARARGDGPGPSVEILLLVPGERRRTVLGAALSRLARYEVRALPVSADQATSAAVDEAVHGAWGEHVVLMSARQGFREGTLQDLRTVLTQSGAAAVHPVVLGGDLLLRDLGVVYPPNGRDPVPFLEGVHPDSVPWTREWFPVPGAPVPLLARTASVRALRGEAGPGTLWADIDLSQRLAAHEGRPVVVARDVVAVRSADGAFDDTTEPQHDLAAFRAAWERNPSGSADLFEAFGLAPVFTGLAALTVPRRPKAWTRALWLPSPGGQAAQPEGATGRLQVREAPPALRWAIKTAMPASDRARQWGDFHFAHSLAAALRALGQEAVVDYGPNDARETSYRDDVVLMLRGRNPARLPADATSVVWVISHPEEVTAAELAGYDLRYAASLSWASDATDRWDLPVRPLLQCTDPSRFYIDDEPVAEVVGKAVLVGNSRGKARPVAVEAVRSGTPVAVYGSSWSRFLPPEVIAGTYVPNEIVRRYYRSAAWALNDHWPDMRELGFVSNRVFDVLASGGRLLTDDVHGLDEITRPVLPEGGLPRFTTPEELHALLAEGSAAWYDDVTLRSLSEHVRKEHGFGARAATLVEGVLAHRAAGGAGV